MRIELKQKTLFLYDVDIAPEIVFDCGQAFRFHRENGVYTGVAMGKAVRITKTDAIEIYPVEKEDVPLWIHYFDLDLDYAQIRAEWADKTLLKCVENIKGMRLLNQEPFETIISFIISANNNVKRIGKTIENLCEAYGEPIFLEGEKFFAFPSAERLALATREELLACGTGYRAPYIIETAKKVINSDILNEVKGLPYEPAKKLLCTLPGVGPKVADCILLFAFEHKNAFPKDVWIRRVIKTVYGKDLKKDKEIDDFAAETFGAYAGIAQQYLFHYARLKKIAG